MRSNLRIIGFIAAIGATVAAPNAIAGTYDVYACGGPAGSAQNAFHAGADSLMSAYSLCPASNIATGVATKVTSSGGVVPHLAGAYQIFDAPPGATVERVNLSIAELRMDSSWTVGVVAYDHFDLGQLVFGCAAGGPGCDVATPSFYGPVDVSIGNRRSFRLETRCGSVFGCSATSSGKTPANRALFSATNIAVRVSDVSGPALGVGGPIWSGGWHRGRERVDYSSSDNVGIRFNRVRIDGKLHVQDDFADQSWHPAVRCDFTRPRPCGDVLGRYKELDTSVLSDGGHVVRVEAVDAAGNETGFDHAISVDNTAPERIASIRLAGGEFWRRSNAFSVAWTTPGEQTAPVVRAHYRICRVGTGECTTGSRAADGIEQLADLVAPGRGEYTLRVWLEDAAGNADPEHASDPVRLRFDDRPPQGFFAAPDWADPAAVRANVVDRESAVASAGIELRREGGHLWQELPTQFGGDWALTRVNDLDLPDGVYRLRLRAVDLAGNELLTDGRADGSSIELRLPLRLGARVEANVRSRKKTTRKCAKRKRKRNGKRGKRRCRRYIKHVAVAGDGRALLRGALRTAEGQPIAGANVIVRETARSQPDELRSVTVRTDRLGRFSHSSGAGPSRSVVFRYAGSRLVKPAAVRIDLTVAARSSIRVRPRTVRNGRSILITGRLVGGRVPRGGKLIGLQAHFRGRWRTFATPRTDARGRWRYRYRFGATRGRVRYRLRARVPFEAAYPFATGRSRKVHVVVRG